MLKRGTTILQHQHAGSGARDPALVAAGLSAARLPAVLCRLRYCRSVPNYTLEQQFSICMWLTTEFWFRVAQLRNTRFAGENFVFID